jgi:hypothetical protein
MAEQGKTSTKPLRSKIRKRLAKVSITPNPHSSTVGLESINELSSQEAVIQNTYRAAQALLTFERRYAQTDARLKQLAIRLEGMAHSLREWLAENELEKNRQALYPFLFPNMDAETLLEKLLKQEASFASWQEEFQSD